MKLLLRISLGLVFTVIILVGIVFAAMRLTLHNIDRFQSELEYVLSGDETRRVTFSRVIGSVRGFNPYLYIEDVSIALPDQQETISISHLSLEFDFWESLRYQIPILLEMSGELDSMQLYRDTDGRWWLNEIELGANATEEYTASFGQILALVPRYLDLDLDKLVIRDDVASRTHELDEVNLRIDSREDQLRLQLAASLPDSLGEDILVKSSISADRGLVYLSTTGLRISPLIGLLDLEAPGLQDGVVDGEVWINLQGAHAQVVSVAGDVAVREGLLQVDTNRAVTRLEYRSRFNAFNRQNHWMVANQVVELRLDDANLQPFLSQVLVETQDRPGQVSIWLDQIELSSLSTLAQHWLPNEVGEQLRQAGLRGRLEDALVQIDPAEVADYRAQARLVGVSSRRHGKIPGIVNLDADIVAIRDRMQMKLAGENVKLDFGDEFAEPLHFDRFAADVVGQNFESGIVLSAPQVQVSNADLRTWGRMWLKFDESDRPFAFIRAQFADGDGSSTRKYLPVKILPPKALRWLDAGIKDGYIPRGELQYHGRLRDLRQLAPQQAVEFLVDFEVERGRVFFQPGWLDARDGKGRVIFHNTSMLVDLEQVSYDSLSNARASAYIANLGAALLELDISAEVPATEALEVWARTPVGEKFRDNIGKVDSAQGEVRTEIDVTLPIGVEGEERTSVVIDMSDVEARSDAWGLELTEVNGRIDVLDGRLEAKGINARFFGDPIRADIAQDTEQNATVIVARGEIVSRHLMGGLPEFWQKDISGKSDWRVRLALDNEGGGNGRPFMQIRGRSGLNGTRIQLPQPFNKPAEQSRAVTGELNFFTDRLDIAASYGADMQIRGQFLNRDDGYQFEALDIGFATPLPSNPGKGLNLYGQLRSIAVDDWLEFAGGADATSPNYLRSANLTIDEVIVFNRLLDRVELNIERSDDLYLGRIDSSLARGDFELPLQPSAQQPLVFNMEFVKIDKLEQESDYSALTPSGFTDFRFSSDSLIYHDMLVNDVLATGRVAGETLHVDELRIRRDQINLTSSGIWEYDIETDTHRSSLNINVQGNELGTALSGLGFGESISEGTIDLKAGFTWPAPIIGFDLENMVGDATLVIDEGVLNSVEPGSGRFVGLLSLSALPRRLSLDFSDVMVEGMVFEQISGTYRMSDGNLYTEDTRLEGPAATIKIAGRTGIVERDYDQTVKVTPEVSGVLSLGALYAGNWALLLLQNLFQKAIDDAFEIEYKISGSWDDPQIDLIKAVDENQRDLPQFER